MSRSYDVGKVEITKMLKQGFTTGSTCLDVGAGMGTYYWLLGEHFKMDAVEVFPDFIDKYGLDEIYDHVFNVNIKDLRYKWYDFIIFGDVIEHMTVEDAQQVIQYALPRCHDLLVAVPYELEQDAIEDNEYEIHLQPDLTKEIMEERYPYLELILDCGYYGYYHRRREQ